MTPVLFFLHLCRMSLLDVTVCSRISKDNLSLWSLVHKYPNETLDNLEDLYHTRSEIINVELSYDAENEGIWKESFDYPGHIYCLFIQNLVIRIII